VNGNGHWPPPLQLCRIEAVEVAGLSESMPREQTQQPEALSGEARAQMLAHQRFLSGEPVAQLIGEEFPEGEGGMLRFRIAAWYEKRCAAVVDVEGLGSIKLDSRAVERSLQHGRGRAKIAAFAAVPDVLRGGRIIHREALHGTKDGDFVHMAAPVNVAGKPCIADVVVKADRNGSRMYLHDVMLIDDLRQPATRIGGGAAEAAEQQPSLAGAGVAETVIRRIFSVKEVDAGAG